VPAEVGADHRGERPPRDREDGEAEVPPAPRADDRDERERTRRRAEQERRRAEEVRESHGAPGGGLLVLGEHA
jgi:hypothetical protein